MYQLCTFRDTDPFVVACNMREEDVAESEANGFEDPFAGLLWSVELSDNVATVVLEGHPVGIFGWSDLGEGVCELWLAGTDDLTRYPVSFHKIAKAFIEELLAEYDCVTNEVFIENHVHLEWLSRLGATFEACPDEPFLTFEIYEK